MQRVLWSIAPNCVRRAALVAVDLAFGAAERTLGILPLSAGARRMLRRAASAARCVLPHRSLREPPLAVSGRASCSSAQATLNAEDALVRRLRTVERHRDVLLLVLAHAVHEVHDLEDDADSNEPETPTSACALTALNPASFCSRRVRWANEMDTHIVHEDLDGTSSTSQAPSLPPRLSVSG